MTAPPVVSVLMSCFNASRWLDDAVQSVLSQSFRDFELILIDDGSTDDTVAQLRKYQAHDRRVVVIEKAHSGLTDSLNLGLERARGKWLARIDSDDLCEPTRLERQYAFVQQNEDIVLVGCNSQDIDERGQITKLFRYPASHRQLVQQLERMRNFFSHSSAFYRLDAARTVSGYRLCFRKSQDWDLWLRLAELGQIACLQEPLVRLRRHAGQIQNSTVGRSQLTYAFAASTCRFIRRQGGVDPSTGCDEKLWQSFLDWIQQNIEQSTLPSLNKMWLAASQEYNRSSRNLTSAARLSARVLSSGRAFDILSLKVRGTSMPREFARKWIQQAQTA